MKVDKLNQLLEGKLEYEEGYYIVKGIPKDNYFETAYIQSVKESKVSHSNKEFYAAHWESLENKKSKIPNEFYEKNHQINRIEFNNLKYGQKVMAVVGKNLDEPDDSVVVALWLIDKPKTILFSKPRIELD